MTFVIIVEQGMKVLVNIGPAANNQHDSNLMIGFANSSNLAHTTNASADRPLQSPLTNADIFCVVRHQTSPGTQHPSRRSVVLVNQVSSTELECQENGSVSGKVSPETLSDVFQRRFEIRVARNQFAGYFRNAAVEHEWYSDFEWDLEEFVDEIR